MSARGRWTLSIAWAVGALSGPLAALECRTARFESHAFAVCGVDPAKDDLRFYWTDDAGKPLRTFDRVRRALAPEETLAFATNGGIFSPQFRPLGLTIENSVERVPLNRDAGTGNFYLKPNGVFFVRGGRAAIADAALDSHAGASLATQSGPLLVSSGAVNAHFRPDSANRVLRSGVGVVGGKAFFAISEGPVNFHRFARFFRDGLGCDDALYLDGVISKMRAPLKGHAFADGDFAGIIAVVQRVSSDPDGGAPRGAR